MKKKMIVIISLKLFTLLAAGANAATLPALQLCDSFSRFSLHLNWQNEKKIDFFGLK